MTLVNSVTSFTDRIQRGDLYLSSLPGADVGHVKYLEDAVVRSADVSDIDAILSFIAEADGVVFKDWENKELLTFMFATQPNFSQVATTPDGELIGVLFAAYGPRPTLHHLYVTPEHRGKGIGSELINMAFSEIERRSAQRDNKCIFVY